MSAMRCPRCSKRSCSSPSCKVDVLTLVLLMGASVAAEPGLAPESSPAGRAVGCKSEWESRCWQPRAFFLMSNLNLFPAGGTALILQHWRLWVGVVGSLILGALMTLGIGLYAPCMILVSLLGMDPKAAFPIMMGSCAFLMPVASARFIQAGSYSPRVSLGLALGGLPGVLIAALIVKSLPLTADALAGGSGGDLRGLHHAALGCPASRDASFSRPRRSQAILNTDSPWAPIYDQAY